MSLYYQELPPPPPEPPPENPPPEKPPPENPPPLPPDDSCGRDVILLFADVIVEFINLLNL